MPLNYRPPKRSNWPCARLRILLLFGFGLHLVDAQSRAQQTVATVRFNIIDCFGRHLDYKTEKFIRSDDSADFSKHFRGLEGTDIPLGDYRYVLARAEAPTNRVSGQITIRHSKEWITI